jgi:hypothetical protein
VDQDLAAERPAVRAFGGIGLQQIGKLVLLAPRLLEVVFQYLGDGLGRRGVRCDRVNQPIIQPLDFAAQRPGMVQPFGRLPGPEGRRACGQAVGAGYFRSCLAMTMRWTWLVPS